MIWLGLFAAWYAFGWWYGQHVWRRDFDLDTGDAAFITVFAIFGPLMGIIWSSDQSYQQPPKEYRKLLRKHGE